jgi:hypothetical protein
LLVVPPSPRRKPLSSIDQNSGRKVQLKLDSFFSRPKPKKEEPKKEVPKKAERKEKAYPTPANTSRRIVSSDNEDEATYMDASPSEDACTLDACVIPSEDDFIVDDDEDEPPSKRLKRLPSQKPKSRTVQRKLTTSGGAATSRASRQAADQSDLPPISDIPRMFDDLVSRAPKLGRLVDRLNGRPLRVATMCSGTESPLLALRMITRSLAKVTGKKLGVEHIFSCEIEPFKQAYIERNFAPPILFRDVLELEHDYAYTPPITPHRISTLLVFVAIL